MDETRAEIPASSAKQRAVPTTHFQAYAPSTTAAGPEPEVARMRTLGSSALAPVIGIDQLYPAPGRPELVKALTLLADADDMLGQARHALRAGDPIEADGAMTRVQLLLPDLFSCRSIGDGFANIINSLHFSFINQHGAPFTSNQVTTIWRVLRELRNHPFLSFDASLDHIDELEKAGLNINPGALTDLVPEVDV